MGKRKEPGTKRRPKKGPTRKKIKLTKEDRLSPKYERAHERFTWKGVVYADGKKALKVLHAPRHGEGIAIAGSCTWFSVASALEAAYRACGIEVGQMAWEDLAELVGPDLETRITSYLRVLKYKGIRTRADYLKGNLEAKRYKISQYTAFCNVEVMDMVLSGLEKDNIKALIDNALSKSPVICHFPISENYYEDFKSEMQHIYQYDETRAIENSEGIATHSAVVTSFGFEEETPYFEVLDCNGKKFGKKGFCRILPSSIFGMYSFDVVQD